MDENQDFRKLSDQELLDLYEELSVKVKLYDQYQYAMKILINSLYGALGTNTFRYYKLDMAEGITLTGQLMAMYIGNKVNAFLSKLTKAEKDFIIAGDTDSVTGETVIRTEEGELSIEDIFIQAVKKLEESGEKIIVTKNGAEVIPVDFLKALTLQDGKLVYKPVKYVMRHEVTKPLHKVRTKSGNEVTVTEDHSLMVYNNGVLQEATVHDLSGDELVEVS